MTLIENSGTCPDQFDYDTRDGEIARRNIMFGLWAGRRIGLKGNALETYAWSVHLADRHAPGHDDVIAKVATDLTACGKPMNDRFVRDRLREMTMRAILELAQSDREAITSLSSRARRKTKKPLRKTTRDLEKAERWE